MRLAAALISLSLLLPGSGRCSEFPSQRDSTVPRAQVQPTQESLAALAAALRHLGMTDERIRASLATLHESAMPISDASALPGPQQSFPPPKERDFTQLLVNEIYRGDGVIYVSGELDGAEIAILIETDPDSPGPDPIVVEVGYPDWIHYAPSDAELRSLAIALEGIADNPDAAAALDEIARLLSAPNAFRGLPECRALDVVKYLYQRMPDRDEAVALAGPCMRGVTRKFSPEPADPNFRVAAHKGEVSGEPGIILRAWGKMPPGGGVVRELEGAVRRLGGKLLGHPTAVTGPPRIGGW